MGNGNGVKTAMLLAGLGALFMAIGAAFGGSGGLVIGLVIGLTICGGTYWFSDRLAIASARAQPVTREQDPALHDMVADLAARAGIPVPAIYVSPERQPNAFATGRSPQRAVVCVTEGIREMLPPDELRGVLAHEMAHVKHRDILIGSVAAAVAMGITFLARMLMWGALLGGGDDDDSPLGVVGLLAMVVLAPIAAALIQMAISRSREFDADAGGAAMLGTGEPLARALEKIEGAAKRIPMQRVNPAQESAFIVNPFQAPGPGRRSGKSFADYFRTHPPTEERVARLRAMTF
ncbi:MAG: zinc metalloprotease HtpX [Actinomycetota bacterium]